MNFTFDGNISREVLENYLSRSVTAAGLYESKTLEDDLRAIREMGVKFLGRASGIWYMTMDDEEHFRLSKELADKVHAQDPEVILPVLRLRMDHTPYGDSRDPGLCV